MKSSSQLNDDDELEVVGGNRTGHAEQRRVTAANLLGSMPTRVVFLF